MHKFQKHSKKRTESKPFNVSVHDCTLKTHFKDGIFHSFASWAEYCFTFESFGS